jgi:thymidylate kinase
MRNDQLRRTRAGDRLRNHKVLLTGIDGSGKSTCLDMLIERLQRNHTVTKVVNRDASIYRNGQRFVVRRRLYETIESMRAASVKHHFYSLFLVAKFLYKRYVIGHVLRHETSDLTLFEFDLLLHPSVHLVYHFPFTRHISRRLRFRLMSRLTGAKRDFSVFHLETDPVVAMERIRRRGAALASHENVGDLRALKEEFDRVIEIATALGYRIDRIDTTDKEPSAVADEIESILASRLRPPPSKG